MEWNYLLLFGLSLIFYFVVHSLLAHQKIKAYLMERFIPKQFYRILYNALAILFLLPVFWVYSLSTSQYLFKNEFLVYLGGGLLIVGTILLFFSLRQYDLSEFSGTQQLQFDEAPTSSGLRIDGLNAIVRHPLYTSSLFIFWGWFLYQPTDSFLILALISTCYIYIGTRLEEQKLVMAFGKDYVNYQRSVGMFFPKIF